MSFTGVTFANQKVSPSDDAIIRRAILPDGILTGCGISYSGSTLTMASGQLMVCGRQIRHPSAQNWAVVDATSGFARLVLTVDLTRTASKETFDQVTTSIEYASAEDGFVELEQSDINVSGTRYQVAVCVVSLGAGGITGIVSQLEKSAVDGSGALNFKVVGGVTQPSGPAENTIWVSTTQKITAWIFSHTAPADPVEGMVWFSIGTSGQVEMNALKKNGIQLFPISASQYVGGAWQTVSTMIWQEGAWTEWWDGFLYNSGDECTDFGGEWISEAIPRTSGGDASARTITKGDTSLSVAGVTNKGTIVRKAEKINLSGKSILEFTGALHNPSSSGTEYWASICVWSEIGASCQENVAAVYHQKSGTSSGSLTVDVSALDDGEYYVGFALYGGATLNMTSLQAK